jgi:hypothetical protein
MARTLPVIQYDLPQEFVNAFSQDQARLRPKRIGANRLQFTSPFEEYPGTITTPMFLSAVDYAEWWEQTNESDEGSASKKDHWSFADWSSRFHVIKHWDLEDENGIQLDSDVIEKTGMKLPDMRIITWILTITQPVLAFSVSIPNSPRPLKDTSEVKSDTADKKKATT